MSPKIPAPKLSSSSASFLLIECAGKTTTSELVSGGEVADRRTRDNAKKESNTSLDMLDEKACIGTYGVVVGLLGDSKNPRRPIDLLFDIVPMCFLAQNLGESIRTGFLD